MDIEDAFGDPTKRLEVMAEVEVEGLQMKLAIAVEAFKWLQKRTLTLSEHQIIENALKAINAE